MTMTMTMTKARTHNHLDVRHVIGATADRLELVRQ
jgi:hypothetical protein